jgi:hypothetical protein
MVILSWGMSRGEATVPAKTGWQSRPDTASRVKNLCNLNM